MGLQVSPTVINLSLKDNIEQMYLSNTGSQLLRGQVRIYAWTQENGNDILSETKDIQVSPPVIDISPGETQLVRLVKKTTESDVEQAYRVIVDELPSQGNIASQNGVQLLMRYSVPVFVSPVLQKKSNNNLPDHDFSLQNNHGNLFLMVKNNQQTHLKISELTYLTQDGKTIMINPGLVGYVLAGQSGKWKINKPYSNGQFQAILNNGPQQKNILAYSD